MFYDYEEYLTEPTEADKLMEEMKDKLHDLIKSEAKEMMKGYMDAKENLCDLDLDIMRKKGRISNLQQKIEELEEKYENIDKHKMPRKYIDAFVRDYTGNFAPGDKVFIIDRSNKRVTCDKCKGEKKVNVILDGEEIKINCIECKGYGAITEVVRTIKETHIDKVRLKLVFNDDRVTQWSSECVEVVGREYKVDPKDIFRSYEDAKKVLDDMKQLGQAGD